MSIIPKKKGSPAGAGLPWVAGQEPRWGILLDHYLLGLVAADADVEAGSGFLYFHAVEVEVEGVVSLCGLNVDNRGGLDLLDLNVDGDRFGIDSEVFG